MDGVMDRLAAAVGISDGRCASATSSVQALWGPGQVMDDGAAGAEECLDGIKPEYDAAVAAGKAVGLGLGLKNAGLGNGLREVSGAVVRFHGDDDRVEVRHGWTEMGQGVHTVAPRWPPRSSTSTRHASTSSSTPHASSASGRRQVHAAR